MAKWIFLNNNFISEDEAFIYFKDLSFQRGYGMFDFFRLVGHKPLFLDYHLKRFYASAKAMHLQISLTEQEIKEIIQKLVERNNLSNTGIRLSLTGGYSPDGFSITSPNLLITQNSFSTPSHKHISNGIKLITYQHVRQLPQIKTTDYLMAIWLQTFLKEQNADDILYHQSGVISECTRNNFFLVTKDEKIVTPHKNILHGITRQKLLELASKEFKVEEREVRLEEIITAREAFITGTIKQILPVAQIDNTIFKRTEISSYLLKAFRLKHYQLDYGMEF